MNKAYAIDIVKALIHKVSEQEAEALHTLLRMVDNDEQK